MTNKTAPRYTVSMLCHNKLELTQKCVASVLANSADYEFIITDNASTDETPRFLESIKAKFPHVRVIRNDQNLGFKDPHENALKLARGEFFVLLNNDMEVCSDWLGRLSEPFAGNPKMAVTGVAGTCCTIDSNLRGQPVGCEGRKEPEYVEGSCLMIPTGLARRIGLFAPWLKFIYWEDTELSLRVRELGYQIKLIPLPMRHDKPGSTSKTVPETQEALRVNTEQMSKRWGFYFKRRDMKRRILVRRLGAHGDVLLATPALKALRDTYPNAEIGVVTKCPNMLKGLDWITTLTKKRTHYDEFHDLDRSYEERPDLHIVDAFAQKLGVTLPKRWQMHMATKEEDEVWAERTSRSGKLALIHPGISCWPGKNWPVERFEEVVNHLQGKGYMVATVGDQHTPKLATDLHLAGITSPQQLYALAKRSKLFIGIDSMPQHVASAADCPSVVLFGPTNPRCIIRPTPRIAVVQADVKDVPCVGEHGRRTTPITQCPCDAACMDAIKVEWVVKAIEKVERISQ